MAHELRCTFIGNLFLQQVINVYHYDVSAAWSLTDDATAIAANLEAQLIEPLQVITSDQLHWTLVRIHSYDEGFAAEFPLDDDGSVPTATADCAPPFVAYKFQLHRATGLTRHGWKRFPGVPENYLTQTDIDAVGELTEIAAMAGALAEQVTVGGFTLTPFIARLSADGSAVLAKNGIQIATFNGFTTQNTRKVGRGA